MHYVSTLLRCGGDYYYILCCPTVNDDKLDQASGYGHSAHSSGIAVTMCLVHLADEILYNNYKVGRYKPYITTIRLDALSGPHN